MKVNAKKIAGVGLLTALVVVLQLLGSFIKFGTVSISLVLIPIVVGAALYGVGAGWAVCSPWWCCASRIRRCSST